MSEDIFGDLENVLTVETDSTNTNNISLKSDAKAEDEIDAIIVPLHYQIFSTHNGEHTGKKDIVDTYKCDKVKGIIPIGKARIKADLLKNAFKSKTFFVLELSSKILTNGKVRTAETIVYQTK